MLTKDILQTNNSIADSFIKKYKYPYEVLPNIKENIIELGNTLNEDYIKKEDNIWIHKTAKIGPSVEIHGPCIIDEEAEIRHNAFIRGSAIIGKRAVFGNSCEIKNAILYDEVQVPHFSYVGDSIIGYKSHLGASAITSNLKSNKTNIIIQEDNKTYDTKLRKIGAIIGDNVEVGCGSILNPGTIIYSDSQIYPLTSVRGVIKANKIVKTMDNIIDKEER